MRRTTIYLEPELEVLPKLEMRRTKRPMAEIVREAIRALQASGELAHPERLAARSLPLGEQALQLLHRASERCPSAASRCSRPAR